MIARCACGRVQYEMMGRPIVSLDCFCDDCQAGARQLEVVEPTAPVADADGGTAYVVYRKDRVRCVRGTELLVKRKLRERSATSRVVAGCCHSPMLMWFDDSKHWCPIYRGRVVDEAPRAQMRVCTRFANGNRGRSDVPEYSGYPVALLAKLLFALAAMFF